MLRFRDSEHPRMRFITCKTWPSGCIWVGKQLTWERAGRESPHPQWVSWGSSLARDKPLCPGQEGQGGIVCHLKQR